MVIVYFKQRTPKKISKRVAKFLNDAGLAEKPIYLPFTNLSDDYKNKYCLNNCEAEYKKTNCKIVYGWAIWEDKKNRFIEAEFHAVVKKNGKLLDITPRADQEDKLLFVPDLERIPTRINECTWRTWTNIKSWQGEIEQAKVIDIIDSG